MAVPRDQQHQEVSLVSMSELLQQIKTNRKHFELHVSPEMRFCKHLGYSVSMSSSATGTGSSRSSLSIGSVSALSTPMGVATELSPVQATELPPVRELDVNPDTFMLLCFPFPVMKVRAIRRKVCTWFRNLVWPRPPMPCGMTTCGPVFHVRSCEFHPLTGALPYEKPVRHSISLP